MKRWRAFKWRLARHLIRQAVRLSERDMSMTARLLAGHFATRLLKELASER